MAQDWAGFSEEELRRLKQNKGSVDVRAGAESCVRQGLEASRVGEGAWGLEVQVGGRAGTVGRPRDAGALQVDVFAAGARETDRRVSLLGFVRSSVTFSCRKERD